MSIEDDFRLINGRAPSDAEQQRMLAFERLAKSADYDPLTMVFMVNPPHRVAISFAELRAGIIGGLLVAVVFCVAATARESLGAVAFVAAILLSVAGTAWFLRQR